MRTSTGPSDANEGEIAMTPTDPSRTEQVDAIDSDSIDSDSINSDRPPSSGLRRGLLTAAVVALALTAAGATGAALARGGSDGEAALAAASSTPTPSDDERRADKDFRHGGPGGRLGHHLLGGPGGALHGSFVVPDGDGGFQTMLTQRGTASKVSSTSITVRSEDGFSQTYAITSDTGVGATRDGVSGIKNGADVMIVAEQEGGKATAVHVVDLDALGGPGVFRHRMDGPGPDGGPPVPAPTDSAEGSAYGV